MTPNRGWKRLHPPIPFPFPPLPPSRSPPLPQIAAPARLLLPSIPLPPALTLTPADKATAAALGTLQLPPRHSQPSQGHRCWLPLQPLPNPGFNLIFPGPAAGAEGSLRNCLDPGGNAALGSAGKAPGEVRERGGSKAGLVRGCSPGKRRGRAAGSREGREEGGAGQGAH